MSKICGESNITKIRIDTFACMLQGRQSANVHRVLYVYKGDFSIPLLVIITFNDNIYKREKRLGVTKNLYSIYIFIYVHVPVDYIIFVSCVHACILFL